MKCKVLNPFVDKHTGVVYATNEIVDFKDKRVKEIEKKNKNLIEVIEEEKVEEAVEKKAEEVAEEKEK